MNRVNRMGSRTSLALWICFVCAVLLVAGVEDVEVPQSNH